MNLLQSIPDDLSEEIFEDLLSGYSFRLERIISKGQRSEPDFWYDQDEHEWVVVLTGYARLQYPDGKEVELRAGDHIKIPAHTKHRVSYTTPDEETIWLAIFYKD
ncbi:MULTISPECIES: cupin domain-containing protein [unclassified Vibrio]|uniref:cupin domain-containing protein n=1 Tax=unclassified Vibrio TaxID=2614977 RepID=UPI001269033F|nr:MULTISPECIES: cupin domain-containing protein [unclassified Vibrio]QFT38511.1 Cupin domain protein [Vibrio sp. THAF64]QGM36951.1 Cupin domain protein [Vibrio sp. THAF191d]QGN72291.1 Cupin domain protein [Vibrio sp. THAF191c]